MPPDLGFRGIPSDREYLRFTALNGTAIMPATCTDAVSCSSPFASIAANP